MSLLDNLEAETAVIQLVLEFTNTANLDRSSYKKVHS
jgi:hypothetical protein